MATFANAILQADPQIARAAALAMKPLMPTDDPGRSIGLFWMCEADSLRWHNGATHGSHSMLAIDLAERQAVIALWDAAYALEDICLHLLNERVPRPTLPVERCTVASSLRRYEGTFRDYTGCFEVVICDSRLKVVGRAGGDFLLHRLNDTTFFSKKYPGSFTFEQTVQGFVTGIVEELAGVSLVRATKSGDPPPADAF